MRRQYKEGCRSRSSTRLQQAREASASSSPRARGVFSFAKRLRLSKPYVTSRPIDSKSGRTRKFSPSLLMNEELAKTVIPQARKLIAFACVLDQPHAFLQRVLLLPLPIAQRVDPSGSRHAIMKLRAWRKRASSLISSASRRGGGPSTSTWGISTPIKIECAAAASD